MSSASVTSSKRETTSELMQEIESIRAMNSSLRAYLDNLRAFRKNVTAMDDNCKQLNKVNSEWIETLKIAK